MPPASAARPEASVTPTVEALSTWMTSFPPSVVSRMAGSVPCPASPYSGSTMESAQEAAAVPECAGVPPGRDGPCAPP